MIITSTDHFTTHGEFVHADTWKVIQGVVLKE